MALLDYIHLLKLKYSLTYVAVILGALFFASEIDFALIKALVGLFVSFVILFYGAIYTLNDIYDLKSDQKHPLKKNRPLASGNVSAKSAKIFSAILIGAGLVTCFLFFGYKMIVFYALFFALNIFYTCFAKKIPYFELVINAASHPLRFLMGVQLVSNQIPYYLLLALFWAYIGLGCVRRIVEMDIKGGEIREVLKSYSEKKLLRVQLFSFLAILPLPILDKSGHKLLYAIIIAAEILLVFGVHYIRPVKAFSKTVWTK
jgi:decaprenyl-phosphate phosphoribosyltransferase